MDIGGAFISFWYISELDYVSEWFYCSDIVKQNQEKLEEMKVFSKWETLKWLKKGNAFGRSTVLWKYFKINHLCVLQDNGEKRKGK